RRSDLQLDEVEVTGARLPSSGEIDHLSLLLSSERYGQSEGLQLLHENVERLRNPWLRQVLALDDRFVDARTTRDVVRFDRQDFLQRVRGAVSFQRPHFHFTEALAAELRLTGERLLRDQRVRSDRTRVNFVV